MHITLIKWRKRLYDAKYDTKKIPKLQRHDKSRFEIINVPVTFVIRLILSRGSGEETFGRLGSFLFVFVSLSEIPLTVSIFDYYFLRVGRISCVNAKRKRNVLCQLQPQKISAWKDRILGYSINVRLLNIFWAFVNRLASLYAEMVFIVNRPTKECRKRVISFISSIE